ncbi:Metallo-dependent phosphatase-like protein [Phakopsora pachyrhizi]|nr:Metallo-dependent phosphatase-like protein [Phakopsora pachyrhizi]
MLTVRYRRLIVITLIIISTYFLFLSDNQFLKSLFNSSSGLSKQQTFKISSDSQSYRSRVVAVGDLHGDLPHTVRVLRLAGLIDLKNQWVGERTVLVQTGDIVDRGKDTILLYQLMGRLRKEAKAAGGEVINLLGNHEYMNALDDWRYVTKEDIESFGGKESRRRAMSSNGWIGKDWLKNYSVSTRVPSINENNLRRSSSPIGSLIFEGQKNNREHFESSGSGFVHGGITIEYARLGIEEINRIGRSLLNKSLSATEPIHHLPRDVNQQETMFYSEVGPLWDRSYALESDLDLICDQISRVTEILKIKRLVMGHTPQFKGITSRCDGKILLIDTGISSAYGGPLSALEIIYKLNPTSNSDKDKKSQGGMSELKTYREVEIVYGLEESKLKRTLSKHERMIKLKV